MRIKSESATRGNISFFLMCVVSTSIIFVSFLLLTNSAIINERARMDMLAHGTAYRPFAYRALLPWMTQIISALTPNALKDTVTSGLLNDNNVQRILDVYHINKVDLFEQIVLVTISYLFFLAFPYAFRYLLTGVYTASARVSNLLSIIAPLFLAPLLLYNYVYDFSQITLFTLALALMVERRWRSYLVIYGVGCLNKETTLLLLVPFALYFFRRLDFKQFRLLFGIQVGLWMAIKAILHYIYRNNPGDAIEYHLGEHLPRYLEVMRQTPFVNLFYVALLFLLFWAVFYRYKDHSQFLIYASSVAIPIAVLYLFFGTPYEVRVFYEAYPSLLLLCIFQVRRWTGWGMGVIESVKSVHAIKMHQPDSSNNQWANEAK